MHQTTRMKGKIDASESCSHMRWRNHIPQITHSFPPGSLGWVLSKRQPRPIPHPHHPVVRIRPAWSSAMEQLEWCLLSSHKLKKYSVTFSPLRIWIPRNGLLPSREKKWVGYQWLMPIILATRETEVGREEEGWGPAWAKSLWDPPPSQPMFGHSGRHLSC
jgi:hypothetical protein